MVEDAQQAQRQAQEKARKEFEERAQKFQEEEKKLQEKYSLELYAADIVLTNGEVIPAIRIKECQNENQSKESDIIGA